MVAEHGDSRPVPDPTTLTTEALHREVAMARESFELRISALDRLVMEKFASIEEHRKEQKVDSDTRIQAALAAVKEENSKTASSTAKQIDSLKDTFGTSIAGLTTNLNDLKDRMTKTEGNTGGQAQARANLYAGLSAFVALIIIGGFVFAFVARGG